MEIYKQKNKIFDELNSAYDQINKLNLVLMSKQQQLARSKTINCPHFQAKSRVVYYPSSQIIETPGFNTASSLRSPQKFYERN